MKNKTAIESLVKHWLEDVVIGLRLCPFASRPFQQQRIKYSICEGEREEDIIDHLIKECEHLTKQPEIETTLLICPNGLDDFFDFYQLLSWANSTLKKKGWQGIYQLAHFHPHYCFTGCEPEDRQNLSNRSPFPILHILREGSVEEALSSFDSADTIPENNIKTMESLSAQDLQRYFHFLYKERS